MYFPVRVRSQLSTAAGGRCSMAVSPEAVLQGPLGYCLLASLLRLPPYPPLGPSLWLPSLSSAAAQVPVSAKATGTSRCSPGHVRRLQGNRMVQALSRGLETDAPAMALGVRNEGSWKEVKSPLT